MEQQNLKNKTNQPRLRFNQPVGIIMYGTPGSGKSTFAEKLEQVVVAKWMNGDTLHKGYKFQQGKYEPRTERERQRLLALHDQLGGNYNYEKQVEMAFSSGLSVVRDFSHNTRKRRSQAREQMAKQQRAVTSMIVWMEADIELAKQRCSQRSVSALHYWTKTIEEMEQVMKYKLGVMEAPDSDELYVKISGEIPFREQFAIFTDFCENNSLILIPTEEE